MLPVAVLHKDRLLLANDLITRSETISPRSYSLPGREVDAKQAAVTIRGNGITVDFQGAVLRGSLASTEPDARPGVGLRVEGTNVTIKNARIHGFKVALWAKGVKGLKLVDCDLSYNWRQRLKSTREKEDLSDWMSYHQNERGEWLRYGAAAYLEDCDGYEIKRLRVTGGQNGVMLTRCNGGLIWNSDLRYNSSLGVGMYRSSNNRVMHNRIDYCVRGYSHGVYNRGQDSAGILVYEQSSKNLFAYNSVTHGGDGFFLWAGQSTMDTGQGGCNDNVLYGNDFSYATTNGVEATFSRNIIANNRMEDCWYGLWGGYSFDTLIAGNHFAGNGDAIAIEHGQNIRIFDNRMFGDETALHIWQNAEQDPSWGYPKKRDTRSQGYAIEGNTISANKTELEVRDTSGLVAKENLFSSLRAKLTGTNPGLRVVGNTVEGLPTGILPEQVALNDLEEPATSRAVRGWSPLESGSPEAERYRPKRMTGGLWPSAGSSTEVGRHTILMDEWGPYDGRSLRIWPTRRVERGREKFSLFGPKGRYRVVSSKGLKLSATSGTVPGSVLVERTTGDAHRELILEYIGRETTDYRGVVTPAGKPSRAKWTEFRLPISWNVAFYRWDEELDATDARRHPKNPFTATPIQTLTSEELDWASNGAFFPGGPSDRFATRAEATVTLDRDYDLALTADDGLRLWIDDRLALDEWHYQGPTSYTVKLSKGAHRLRIEHFEIDGYAALQAKLVPRR